MLSGDIKYMRMALRLAGKASGRTSPNPLVGAVVVKNGKVLSRGYHEKAGMPHAEAIALAKAGKAAKGATLYITLEPCSHTNKRTPPCCPLICGSGVKRVVIAMIDPNPHVSGTGIKGLRSAGIEVTTGVLEPEARRLNEAFIKHVTTGKPFVILKIAQTLDGKIATSSGESKWITGREARTEGHRLRDSNDAILVGINTVVHDNPSLTTRIPGGRDPIRVIVDSNLRIPLKAKVLNQKSSARTIIATTAAANEKFHALEKAGAEVVRTKSRQGRVDFHDLMKKLGQRDIMNVLIEGGSEINASVLKAGVVDKVVMFLAPMLMTGRDSLCSIGGICPPKLSQVQQLRDVSAKFVGKDLMITGYLKEHAGDASKRKYRR